MANAQTDPPARGHSQAQVQNIAELEASRRDWRAIIGVMVLLTEDKTSLEIVESVGYAQLVLATWQRVSMDAPELIADADPCAEAVWFESLSQPRSSPPPCTLVEFRA